VGMACAKRGHVEIGEVKGRSRGLRDLPLTSPIRTKPGSE
jgi:hypothetical protein